MIVMNEKVTDIVLMLCVMMWQVFHWGRDWGTSADVRNLLQQQHLSDAELQWGHYDGWDDHFLTIFNPTVKWIRSKEIISHIRWWSRGITRSKYRQLGILQGCPWRFCSSSFTEVPTSGWWGNRNSTFHNINITNINISFNWAI